MNRLVAAAIQLKKAVPLFVVALGCFTVSPALRAISPPPDGGYPNQNTAEGDNALLHLTSGDDNTAVGFDALRTDTIGSQNTAIGSGALAHNVGSQDTAIGAEALLSNIRGSDNTAIGFQALVNNGNGFQNTAIGAGPFFQTYTVAITQQPVFKRYSATGTVAVTRPLVFTPSVAT